MSFEFITSHDSPNYWPGRPVWPPRGVVFHHWDAPEAGATFAGTIATLCHPNRGASANFVVEAGRVACLVDVRNSAWANGNGDSNRETISFELRPGYDEGTRDTVAELIANLWRNGALALDCYYAGHRDVSDKPTACPAEWAPHLAGIMERAREFYAGDPDTNPDVVPDVAPAAPAGPTGAPDVDDLAHAVIRGEYGNGDARRRALGDLYDVVQARVNELLGAPAAAPAGPDLDALARAVIRGEYGNGDARRAALGDLYGAVQDRVNAILS